MRVLSNEEMGNVGGGWFFRWSWCNPRPKCEPKPVCEPKPKCGTVEPPNEP